MVLEDRISGISEKCRHPSRNRCQIECQFFPTSLCGVLVFDSASRPSSRPPVVPPPAQLTHTQLAHTQLAHTQLAHTQLAHTQLAHTQLAHTQLAHTELAHTQLAHIQLAHTTCTHSLLTHNLLTQNLHTHTQLTHTQWQAWHLRGRRGTWRHVAALCVAGVALWDIHLRFTWQAWHVWHWAGSGGALGSHVPEWSPRLFAWQAWHLETFIFVSRGRRGTYGTGLALVARSVPTCPSGRRGFLRGRRGTWRHSSSFHVAGVVLGDIHLRFTWQAWYSTYSHTTCSHATYSHGTYSRTTCTHTTYSRRRRTWRYGSSLCVAGVARMALGWLWWRARFPRARVVAAAFCVAGVALGDIHLRFTWQAWHLVTSTFVSRARRGTQLTHFAWQAWHVWHWASSGGALGSHVPEWSPRLFAWQAWQLETFIFVSRGRRGTWWHPPSFHVAGVVLDLLTHNLFTHNLLTRNLPTHNLHTYNLLMQAWHLETWIVTLRGRRGTYGTGLALVARSVPTCPSGRRGFLRGRRGTWRHSSSFHAAEVVLGDIHLRFTWQAWYSTYSLCVAGVARMALG